MPKFELFFHVTIYPEGKPSDWSQKAVTVHVEATNEDEAVARLGRLLTSDLESVGKLEGQQKDVPGSSG